jgi:hypothetical protein
MSKNTEKLSPIETKILNMVEAMEPIGRIFDPGESPQGHSAPKLVAMRTTSDRLSTPSQ